jgi:hypothetical protein
MDVKKRRMSVASGGDLDGCSMDVRDSVYAMTR